MIMPTLLLVDEERIMAFDLVRRPTTLGSTVLATAGSGREAIQQAVDLRPDLVLMDVGLLGTAAPSVLPAGTSRGPGDQTSS